MPIEELKDTARDCQSIKELAQFSPRYQFYFRVLLYLSAIASIIAVSYKSDSIDIVQAIFILTILGYSYIAYGISHRFKGLSQWGIWLSNMDGIFIGITLSFIHFAVLPSALLLGMVQFNAITQGGFRHWLSNIGGIVIALIIGYLFLSSNQAHNVNVSDELNIATLISALVYLCLYGLCTYKHTENLAQITASYLKEAKEYKLHAYKLSRYLPAPVWDKMTGSSEHIQKTERKRLTIFFSDIVGFSELTEEIESETLTELLNSYLTEMAKVANQFNGTVDKFMGDAIMVMFGDNPKTSKGVKKDAIDCVNMAIEMRKQMNLLQKKWAEMGIKQPLQVRMGINTGYCTVGTFGTNTNLDYTALGTHVNLASRLETAGKPGNILVSFETWSLIKDVIMCRDKGQISVKGFSHPIQVYEVVAHRKELGGSKSYFEETSEGFTMLLDLNKVKNYDKERIIEALDTASKKLKEKVIK